MNEQILQLEKALLRNEAFMTAAIKRHYGKPQLVTLIADDIYTIAKILYDKNNNLDSVPFSNGEFRKSNRPQSQPI